VSLFAALKLLHMGCAFASISGFALRGYWLLSDNPLSVPGSPQCGEQPD